MLIKRCANAIVPVSQFSVEIASAIYLSRQYPPRLLLPVQYALAYLTGLILDRVLLFLGKVLISDFPF